MDIFEKHHAVWLADQAKKRNGEARRRLLEGHGESEKLFAKEIWWPLNGSLDFLHAEYEVSNHRDGSFYLDFAFVRPPHFVDWEIDDFSTHGKHVNRRTFEYERDRQNQLTLVLAGSTRLRANNDAAHSYLAISAIILINKDATYPYSAQTALPRLE
ncbi:hypothetical protein OMP38_13500 [Cohnella ginsengisoli]|uniref:DUF559 domain-containing protein n=1 Tax=Cohnella ginsengisoli TaxID=425004 RepID=A0A9X4QMU7_9BACL|nr:hypothetical protein [Cohnella ginsengisoli]MDG0791766.1 hypothetical protein [Cohnella ginsengisoli]